MKWKKLGKIFDPSEHKLANNCFDFAQSPQTLVFDDYVRIYFSTRERDEKGKFLSHVSFVDFEKNLKKIIKTSDRTVIPLGELGCFDEHGIFPINILKNKKKIYAYTTGWNRKVSVSADASIGLAYSEDNGTTFKKFGSGPVLTASLHEAFLVCDGFTAVFDNTFHMWYIYGTKWTEKTERKEPDRVYKIAHAKSEDGINWVKDNKGQLIEDYLNENECQALPTVIKYNNQFHMYFCYREAIDFRNNPERGYRIGYAYSKDLVDWKRDDKKGGIFLSDEGWDSEMMCYPHIFKLDNDIYLLYNGNEFGKKGFGIAKLEK